jgi:beta-lactamase superfamily II metal-dependent hydrolase
MHRVNKNSPSPVALKAVLSAVLLFLSVFHFAPQASAQAYGQLLAAAPSVEIPYAPAPDHATVYSPAPGLNVYFLSVGQGDSIYIELPGGQTTLIDGGPSGAADGPLAQFLAAKKVTRIDHVVLTHPHSDHYNGLPYVFSNISVGDFYDTRMDNKGATGDDTLRAQVKALNIPTFYPAAGDHLAWGNGGLDVKVFNSCSNPVASTNSNAINNCSIMLKLSYQNASLLLTGDTQNDAEARLVATYGAELKADVLKVGHHGSKYSSTDVFLNAVKPARAYIEVGKNNYGHPTQGALDRLQKSGAKIFRTDLDGTQEFTVPGSSQPVELPARKV